MSQKNGNESLMDLCWNYLGLEVAPKEQQLQGAGQTAKVKKRKTSPKKKISYGPTNATSKQGTPSTIQESDPKMTNPMPVEYVYSTRTISSEADLMKMVGLMKGVTEVALNIYGKFGSRGLTGEAGWVCLFVQDTLVCIDVVKLVGQDKMSGFWGILSHHIFENERILKVLFNSHRVDDYLFQRHGIRLENAFDIQMNWDWDWGRRLQKEKSSELGPPLRMLSECLKEVLPDKVLPEELNFLRESENGDYTSDGAVFLERPIRDKRVYKAVALELKYLLRVRDGLVKALVKSPPPKLSNDEK